MQANQNFIQQVPGELKNISENWTLKFYGLASIGEFKPRVPPSVQQLFALWIERPVESAWVVFIEHGSLQVRLLCRSPKPG